MWTSLQREEIVGMKPNEYLSGLLNSVKNDETIKSYFNEYNIIVNDLSCLTLMQYYGLPTPLLDFTLDVNVALGFAAESTPETIDSEIDRYCSLYYFDLETEYELNISNLQSVLSDGLQRSNRMINEYQQQNLDIKLDISEVEEINKYITLDSLCDLQFVYIEYPEIADKVMTLNNQSLDLSNANIIKQKGGFIFNNKDEQPLQTNWNNRLKISHLSSTKGILTNNKLSCIDIKKDVIKS